VLFRRQRLLPAYARGAGRNPQRDCLARADLLRRLAKVEAAGCTLAPGNSALKRPPRGFGEVANPVLQDLLRRKSLVYTVPPTQAAPKKSSVVETIADFVRCCLNASTHGPIAPSVSQSMPLRREL